MGEPTRNIRPSMSIHRSADPKHPWVDVPTSACLWDHIGRRMFFPWTTDVETSGHLPKTSVDPCPNIGPPMGSHGTVDVPTSGHLPKTSVDPCPNIGPPMRSHGAMDVLPWTGGCPNISSSPSLWRSPPEATPMRRAQMSMVRSNPLQRQTILEIPPVLEKAHRPALGSSPLAVATPGPVRYD